MMSSGRWNSIDRDPIEMISCSKEIKKSVQSLRTTLNLTVNKISGYSTDLDSDCQNSITTLRETVKQLELQLDEYENLAKKLEKNADYILNRPKL